MTEQRISLIRHQVPRRTFLKLGAAAATFGALGVREALAPARTVGAAAPGARPNIVFINTDDLDRASLTTMPKVKSLIGDQGTTFSNFFLNVSLCCPSRSSFLRGQCAHNTQVLTNGGSNGGYARVHALGIENSTIATWLQTAGYHTGLMGKYLNGYPESAMDTYVPPGWNEWYGAVGGGGYKEFNYMLNENGKLVSYGSDPQSYMTDVLAGKAADFITRATQGNQPFFLYIPTFAPHQPATPSPTYANAFADAKAPRPPSYNEQDVSDKPQWVQHLAPLSTQEQARLDELYRKRDQTLQSVDDLVERVINTLQTASVLDNTYIVFSSDNGFHLGEHRERSGKQAPYEEDIRVPLIVRGPGIAAGKTVDALVGNVDFAPTFAEWGGATTPDFVDGRSFAAFLNGNAPQTWRQAFLLEHYTQDRTAKKAAKPRKNAPRKQRAQATPMAKVARGIPTFQGLRAGSYVYIEYETNEKELYDLTKDPDELQNIAGTADSALLGQLSARLAAIKTGTGAAFRTAEEQPVPVLPA